MQSPHYYSNRNKAYEKRLQHYSNMRAAKERKRLENPPAREPKLVRFYPLEFCVRNKFTGQTSLWHDLQSVRRAATQVGLLLKHCS